MTEKALDFWSFLNESKSYKKIKIIMLIGGDSNDTSDSFEKECKKKGIKFYPINANETEIEKDGEGHILINGKKKIKIDPLSTAVLSRSGVLTSTHNMSLAQEIENSGYYIINNLKALEICENKYTTDQYLKNAGLPTPRTALLTSEGNLENVIEKVGGKFPLVMKLLKGSKGIGVSIVDSFDSLKSVYQTIIKLDENAEVLIQEKIDSSSDLRIHVLIKRFSANPNPKNYDIIGYMKRNAVDKDFRTNYSLGGSVSKFVLTKELEELAYKAACVTGCIWSGVDIMIDKKSKKPYILEVNSSPGTEGISKVLGSPIVNKIIKFVSDKANWKYPPTEVGYMEVMNVEGIGDVVALFDSGNGGTACSLHADDIKEKDGMLHWKIGNKKFSKKIIKRMDIYGGANNSTNKEIRAVVQLDLDFNGTKIPNVDVSIVDRERKAAPFLVTRKLMRKLNLSVNSNETFLVTDNFDPDYTPWDARGQAHSGIKALMKNNKTK